MYLDFSVNIPITTGKITYRTKGVQIAKPIGPFCGASGQPFPLKQME